MDYKAARLQMVKQQLRTWNILSSKVTKAMATVPREAFVPKGFETTAYADTNIPLSMNQCILSPKIIGRMLESLSLKSTDRVLVIGTGTGYLTTLLATLTKHVYSLESDESLLKIASDNMAKNKISNVTLAHSHGLEGWSMQGPFDVIIVNGSLAKVPSILKEQLAPKGRLFCFVGKTPLMQACLFVNRLNTKEFAHGSISSSQKGQTKILFETEVPRLPGAQDPSPFEF